MKRDKAVTDQEIIDLAISQGAIPVKLEYWNSTEYGLKYTQGGYFRITKRTYDKLTKQT